MLPHMIFNQEDRMVFRNVAAWDPSFNNKSDGSGNWLELPGPSWLWPDNYDLASHGFMPHDDAVLAKALFIMVMNSEFDERAPDGHHQVHMQHDELRFKTPLEKQMWEKEFAEMSGDEMEVDESEWENDWMSE